MLLICSITSSLVSGEGSGGDGARAAALIDRFSEAREMPILFWSWMMTLINYALARVLVVIAV